MRWRRRTQAKRIPGEYPENFVKGWMALTLPSTTPAEAASAVSHLRSKGWTEQQLAQFILPYLPREPPAPMVLGEQAAAARTSSLPAAVTTGWLDEHLPAMDRRELRLVVDELERRHWPAGTVAMAVLPHLLPKLPAEDARAVVSGLRDLGMSDAEIARATTRP